MEPTTTITAIPPVTAARPTGRPRPRSGLFLGTFLAGWIALDRTVTSPPTLRSASIALVAAGGAVVVGELLAGRRFSSLPARLGFRRPRARGIAAAAVAGGAVVATYVGGALALDIDVEVRSNWPAVLAGVLVFHGLAEELVWRGFVFGHLQATRRFWAAVGASVPLIALTHVPIIAGNGLAIGTVAVLTAAVTSLPFAHVWELSGRTVWAPAILHGLIGCWQLFERTYGSDFEAVVLSGALLVPLTAFLFRRPPDVAAAA